VISVFNPAGLYGAKNGTFTSDRIRGKLTAPASSKVSGNGRYKYGNAPAFPTSTYNTCTYYVDLVFSQQVEVPHSTLIVNAGRDTVIVLPIDSVAKDYTLHGIVTGDGTTFSWRKLLPIGTADTLLLANTLNPVARDLGTALYVFALFGLDKWGNTSEHRIVVEVMINPKQVVEILYQDGQPFIELLQDGTWRYTSPTNVTNPTWFIRGATSPGFSLRRPPPSSLAILRSPPIKRSP
jgi:hypothetical protein